MIVTEKELKITPGYDLSALAVPEELLFFDIETTGLKKETTQLYLIGCAFFENGVFYLRQYLAESALDEKAVMEAFCDFAQRFSVLVHFNGEHFDIPYVAYKADYYDIDIDFSRFTSIDLYLAVRPYKAFFGLPRMNQKTLEVFLQISRADRCDGGTLISVFYDYERSRKEELKELLLLHNFDDVCGMLQLTALLAYADLFEGKFSFLSLDAYDDEAVFSYRLQSSVRVPLCKKADAFPAEFLLEDDMLQLRVRFLKGQARRYLPDVENYYYLPEEDCVVHKDVAQFVDKKHRKKATKKNCFLKKEGRFLPQPKEVFSPCFQADADKRFTFFETECAQACAPERMCEYALAILRSK